MQCGFAAPSLFNFIITVNTLLFLPLMVLVTQCSEAPYLCNYPIQHFRHFGNPGNQPVYVTSKIYTALVNWAPSRRWNKIQGVDISMSRPYCSCMFCWGFMNVLPLPGGSLDTFVNYTVCFIPNCNGIARNVCHKVWWPLHCIRNCFLTQIEFRTTG